MCVSHYSCCQPASTCTIRDTLCVWLVDRTTRRPFLWDAAWAISHHRRFQIYITYIHTCTTTITVIRIPEYLLLCRRMDVMMYTKGGQQDHKILIGGRRVLTRLDGNLATFGKTWDCGPTGQRHSSTCTCRERWVTGADVRHAFRGACRK